MYPHTLRRIGALLLLTPTYACGQSLVERATVHIQIVGQIGQDLGESLGTALAAMRDLARAVRPEQLSKNAFSLFKRFRPAIPEGITGWVLKAGWILIVSGRWRWRTNTRSNSVVRQFPVTTFARHR
jgi:hypothetical protein